MPWLPRRDGPALALALKMGGLTTWRSRFSGRDQAPSRSEARTGGGGAGAGAAACARRKPDVRAIPAHLSPSRETHLQRSDALITSGAVGGFLRDVVLAREVLFRRVVAASRKTRRRTHVELVQDAGRALDVDVARIFQARHQAARRERGGERKARQLGSAPVATRGGEGGVLGVGLVEELGVVREASEMDREQGQELVRDRSVLSERQDSVRSRTRAAFDRRPRRATHCTYEVVLAEGLVDQPSNGRHAGARGQAVGKRRAVGFLPTAARHSSSAQEALPGSVKPQQASKEK